MRLISRSIPSNPRTLEQRSIDDDVRRRALSTLKAKWGYVAYRPGQLEIIESLVSGKDVMAILSTGGGKSICYQVPSILSEGLTLVVSPLISLMEDQVQALVARGIPAWCLSGTQSRDAIISVISAAIELGRNEKTGLLYVSPERLSSSEFRTNLRSMDISFVAIDEAHCVSEWGHDFRPSYRSIPEVYDLISRPPVIAVTATATPRVRADIMKVLQLREPMIHVGNIDRPGIIFSVFKTSAKRRKLDEVLSRVHGSGLVYAPTRRAVDQWTEYLNRAGRVSSKYHAGLTSEERSEAQRAWQDNRVRVMVATNAFGMGIDKADVRSVTHVGLPLSLEGYYQEAGRAGRDGARAYATLLFDSSDVARHRESIRRSRRESIRRSRRESIRQSRRGLQILAYALSSTCRRRKLLGHFGEYQFKECQTCDTCMGRHVPLIPGPVWEDRALRILRAVQNGESPVDSDFEGQPFQPAMQEHKAIALPKGDKQVALDYSLPEYRTRQLIQYLALHEYLELSDSPAQLPRVTRLGRKLLDLAE